MGAKYFNMAKNDTLMAGFTLFNPAALAHIRSMTHRFEETTW
jgi:hypothetical protein